ncbi:hypothetical protein AsAng_0036150 [Aureispira anguillae]|uniref:Uncharacterized protein n=1 Tax=Aureispira anguillae TaxID=2864201 RepID=A0A915YGS8_9BACT|nr:hypothetical protein AsAng_0036150 [Aureispira anguillae]
MKRIDQHKKIKAKSVATNLAVLGYLMFCKGVKKLPLK